MKVLVVGAGQVGTAIVAALHEQHDVTVVDLDTDRLNALSYRYDILTVPGNGASRATLLRAGVRVADLLLAVTDRDEVNIVCALQARGLLDGKVVARVVSQEYLEVWQQGHFPVDFMVSSELETAQAVARAVGMPSAVQTDVFAEGRVQLVEFEVHAATADDLVGRTIAEAHVPDECVVASIIRGDRVLIPGGRDAFEEGDRVVLIASPDAAAEWSRRVSRRGRRIREVVIVGGGSTGRAVARLLVRLRLTVRLIDRDPARARLCAEELPDVAVFAADATDIGFLKAESVGRADAVVCCTDSDERDLLIGLLCKKLGVDMAIAVLGNPDFRGVFEASGIDLAIDQRQVTAEELVRFTHDPRTQAFAMLEDDRAEVLELDVRPESELIGRPFRERPLKDAIVGAIVRGDQVIYPRGDDALQAGDRAIIFAEVSRVAALERAL